MARDKVAYDVEVMPRRVTARGTIVMLTCQYTEILGGAEKQCAGLSGNLRARGYDVLVVTSRVPLVPVPAGESGVKRFWTYRPPQLAGRHLPASLLWAIQVFVWIALNRHRIAVLHCHQLRINAYIAAFANAVFGIPTVMKLGVGGKLNDFYITSTKKYIIGRRGTRFIIRHATRIIATSQQIEDDSLAWGVPAKRVVRIVNGVDLGAASSAVIGTSDPRLATFAAETRLVFVGRLSDEKNVEAIAKAACLLGDGRPVTVEFLGDGPLRENLASYRPVSVDVRLVFRGQVEAVFDYLKSAHFLVLVSSSEGLSNALLEAAAAGVVPIISDASGNRDVLAVADYPFFVADGSPAGIARVMDMARSIPSAHWQAWSERIATASRARFDARHVRERYVELYSEIGKADPRRIRA